ncbi:amidase signature enzyme [Mytilinidion resinicola]|uniref:Amidase signature enzyme n=1 Tax=Mytilinidion resinicola TaxID=574789 RepID=A0A6A6Y733_9PEZI|nr:amidase signature enzyme [Mytilinidion resinicola]KAF2804333.1 amidase signature enzyme [Mytilinidion resinicola]
MSVHSLVARQGNPVTHDVLNETLATLGVTIKDEEKEDYRKLLAVFHDSAVELMDMPDYEPSVDLERFPRENVHFPKPEENKHGAWAWKADIQDKKPSLRTATSTPELLKGKTVVLKDNIGVKDVPMLMGTNFVKDYVPSTDATVVTRVLEAGGHITGKAVCENLCHSATSHSAATGSVQNPFAHGYSSGGSSSGCGVLVALGEADMGIGADQGGSVRIPACNCGLVGFKPTFGLIPYTGCGSNEPTNDHLGPMTRTVLENAFLLQVISGNDNIDDRGFAAPSPQLIPKYGTDLEKLATPVDISKMRIGIIAESLTMAVLDPRVKATFERAAASLKSLGAQVEEVSVPMHKTGPAIWTGVSKYAGFLNKTVGPFGRRGHQMVELNAKFNAMKQENFDEAYVSTKNIYLNGEYARKNFPTLTSKATNLSRKLRDAYDIALQDYDVLITPTLPYIATSHCEPDATPLQQIAKQVGLVSNTCQFNQTGHPALTLPIGMLEIHEGPLKGSGTKLPVGMQIVGKWWTEETILKVAYAWENANDWKKM